MAPTTFTYTGSDGLEITAYRWDPVDEPVAVAQLTHGMGEHVRRYQHLAEALNDAGLVVYGQDHRGHGATAASDDQLGELGPDGWALLIDDLDRLNRHIHEQHPALPVILIGHSLGSYAAQQYVLDHSDRVSAVAMTGTAALDLLEPALNLDEPVDLTMFNAAFQPARTGFDWLSRDEVQVDRYIADPHCGFGLNTETTKAMFAGARRLADPKQIAQVRSDLPVYIAVGEMDPVNGQLALLHPLVSRYQGAVSDVTVHTYPGARHEIFNETNRDEVVADLGSWIQQVLKRT